MMANSDSTNAAQMDTSDWTEADWGEYNGTHGHLDSDEWPEDPEFYHVNTEGSIVRHCGQCGYEGTHDHPRRYKPTFHATLYHVCPDMECETHLVTGAADQEGDC